MEVFRDLLVTASPEQMAAVVAAIEQAPTYGWSIDQELWDRLQSVPSSVGRPRGYYFARRQKGIRPAVTLALMEKDKEPDRYFVSNIVPTVGRSITRTDYNELLGEFVDHVLKPAADSVGVSFRLTDSQADLEHWLSKEAAENLREFSATAIRGLGASHPDDRKKWNEFVLVAHKGGSTLDAATLKRWLVAVEDWDPEVAENLAAEYHYGRELLGYSASRGGI